MATNKTPETAVIKASEMTDSVGRLYAGIDSFLEAAKSKKEFAKLVASDQKLGALSSTLCIFSAVDAKFEGGMRSVGKLCIAILKLDTAAQLRAINAIARTNGLDETKETGRKGMIYALFGRYPDMMRMSGKDTLAGKRIDSYIRAAKTKPNAGPGKGRGRRQIGSGSGGSKAGQPGTAAELFIILFNRCANEQEQDLLQDLCTREEPKIEYEDWVEIGDADETPAGE